MKLKANKRLKISDINKLAIAFGASTMLLGVAYPSEASLLWSRTEDPHNDSHASDGSNTYEIYGGGFAQDNDYAYFALDTNLGLYGKYTGPYVSGYRVADSNIGWGDFFFDPGGATFNDGLATGRMLGFKFAPDNDSLVTSQGVYSGVTGASVTSQNAGFANIASNNYYVGGRAKMGSLDPSHPYYSGNGYGTKTANVIGSGTYIGGLSTIDRSELHNLGFGTYGSGSFGFKVSKSLLPLGDFVATVFQECLNEGFALIGDITPSRAPTPSPQPEVSQPAEPVDVPETTPVVALLALGGLGIVQRILRKQSTVAILEVNK